ncbi:MAG TPA: carboxypeptidase-like regulatory domain-containing protein [Vicinamibacterales bacterium]
MRRTGRWAVVAGAIVWAAIAGAERVAGQGRAGGPPGSGAPSPTGTAVIIGKVIEAGGTTPVAGAVVRLSGGGMGAAGGPFAAATSSGPRLVEVGPSGVFLFTGLPKGSYNLDVTAPGYLPGQYGQERPQSPIPRALDVVRPLDVADGETKADVTIHLWQLGAITGTVVDEYGQPVVGVDVHVTAVAEIWIGRISSNTDTVATDDRGIYRAEVAPGDYIVAVGSSTTTMPAAMVENYWQTVSDQQSFRSAFDQLNANGLTTPPPAGLRVGDLIVGSSFQQHVTPWLWTTGDHGPIFVYPVTYYPSATLSTQASVIHVDAGAERTGTDLQLTPQPAFRISGRLVGPNGPVVGVGLRLIGADFNTKTSSPSLFTPLAATDASGAFSFLGVTPGQYTIDASKSPVGSRASQSVTVTNGNGTISVGMISAARTLPTSEPILWASEAVTVGTTDVTNVLVTLTEGVRISGHFEFPPSVPPPTPDQIRNISVGVRVQPGTVAGRLSGNANLGTAVDDAGTFRTSALVPGPYIIVVNRAPSGWFLRSAITGGKDAADAPIDIGPGGITDLLVTFTNQTTTLTGSVTGNDYPPSAPGQPAPPPTVVIFSTDQNLWPKVALSPRTLRSTAVSPTLTYRTTGLPAGEYFVAASSSAADFTDPKVLAFLAKAAARVTLVEGQSRAQDVHAVVVPAVR